MTDWTIYRFDEIDSTSTWLKTQPNLPHKTVAIANFQSAGRGRLGRQWMAPPATALMISLLLRPFWPVERSHWLTMLSGVAAAEMLAEASGLNVQLKWPNDVVIERDGIVQKLGGILQEAETEEGRLAQAIIGIGLNINMSSADLPPATHTPAASLLSLTGNRFDRDKLAEQLLNKLTQQISRCEQGQSPQKRWENLLITLGKRVTATTMTKDKATNQITGVASGVDEWGRLIIKTDHGELEVIGAGDVTLRY